MSRARWAAAVTVAVGLGFSSGCCWLCEHSLFHHHGGCCGASECGVAGYEGGGAPIMDGPVLEGAGPSACQGGPPVVAQPPIPAQPPVYQNTMPPLSPTPRLVPQPAQPVPYAPPR
jgi:hypothetical protein